MLKRSLISMTALAVAVVGAGTAFAGERAVAHLDTAGTSKVLSLPAAAGNARVISLGEAVDPKTGKIVEGYALIHRSGNAKPDHAGGGNGGGKPNKGGSTCYAFMAKGAKWKAIENWSMNPANAHGLDEVSVFANFSMSVDKWEIAAGTDILGAGSVTSDGLVADTDAPDGVNEVYFSEIAEPGVVGVTIVWGIFGGPPSGRELVEWDQVYEEVDYAWSLTGEAGKMDFENVSTHELGHTIGLTHPDDTCNEETMYRYTDFGETIRRDLHTGDIAGAAALY